MSITDIRKTTLQCINEVRRKRGLKEVDNLTQDSQSTMSLDFLNDVVAEISDYGDWDETVVTANITTQTSVADYAIQVVTSGSNVAVVKSIKDMYFGSAGSPLFFIDEAQMRLFQRAPRYGQPAQYTVFGTDVNGNPQLRLTPIPATNQGGIGVLSVRVHTQPPIYVAGDEAVLVPFNSRIVVQGLYAACVLDEEGGSPTPHYQAIRQLFEKMMKDTYQRFHGDTGRYRRFVPGSRRFRRGR